MLSGCVYFINLQFLRLILNSCFFLLKKFMVGIEKKILSKNFDYKHQLKKKYFFLKTLKSSTFFSIIFINFFLN